MAHSALFLCDHDADHPVTGIVAPDGRNCQMELSISVGRKLMSLGGGRFIDTRYKARVSLPFEDVDATLTGRNQSVIPLLPSVVDTRDGDFNDRHSRTKSVLDIYLTQWRGGTRLSGFDVSYIGLRDRNAVFDQSTGGQIAHTFGLRIFGDDGAWYWNVEAALQRNKFAGHRARACQATRELNFTASLSAFHPGPFIRDTGPARTIRMVGAQTTFRF